MHFLDYYKIRTTILLVASFLFTEQHGLAQNKQDSLAEIAYIEGVEEALESEGLVLKLEVSTLTQCEYNSYLKYGVFPELKKNYSLPFEAEKKKAFNHVMWQRIYDSIPQFVDFIGKLDSNTVRFSEQDYHTLNAAIEIHSYDTIVHLQLVPEVVDSLSFQHLEGLFFIQESTDLLFSFSDLLAGVSLPIVQPGAVYLFTLTDKVKAPNLCIEPHLLTFILPED